MGEGAYGCPLPSTFLEQRADRPATCSRLHAWRHRNVLLGDEGDGCLEGHLITLEVLRCADLVRARAFGRHREARDSAVTPDAVPAGHRRAVRVGLNDVDRRPGGVAGTVDRHVAVHGGWRHGQSWIGADLALCGEGRADGKGRYGQRECEDYEEEANTGEHC